MSTPPAPETPLPTLFCLHALGSSAREFDELRGLLTGRIDVVGLDLPGFGDLSAAHGTSVDEMVASVSRRIRAHGATRWMLLGHSMGGKIASLLAASTLRGGEPLFGLSGVVLVAGSPPTPEPMDESRRGEMLDWVADGPLGDAAVRTFVDANTAGPLEPAPAGRAYDDLRRSSPEAWSAWLLRGSREDRSDDVGELDLPALIVSGAEDGDLGTAPQHDLNGRVYPRADFVEIADAAHLIPLERPRELADAILRFWERRAARGPEIPADWVRLLASPRTAARTRGILARRAVADEWKPAGKVLDAACLKTLRALAARVVPQDGTPIDLAGRLDDDLARGVDDGWRSAALPRDVDAHRLALTALDGFADSSAEEQDSRLRGLAAGDSALGRLDAAAASAWFEDVTAHLVRIWLAHPASLARIGFDGFASGTHGHGLLGFRSLGADEREAWEPAAARTAPFHDDGHERRLTETTTI